MKKIALIVVLTLALTPVFSQSAAFIGEIIAKENATYMDFSYLIASELGMECTPFEAYTWCETFGSFPLSDRAHTPITVKNISYFLMLNYGLEGGLLWSATQSPRYAWRELKAQKFWPAATDPGNTLSGRDMVRAVSNFFNTYPNAKLRDPSAKEADHRYRALLLSEKGETK